jgi:nitroreductase
LKEGNQGWAGSAPVLILVLAENRDYERGNRVTFHDAALAVANLTVQALAEDIYVHQMGGFYAEQARQAYGIPDSYEPVTVLAVGYLAEAGERDLRPRQRKPLQEIVFSGTWGESWSGLNEG